ncbi:MAG TPA: energy-coupling factor transporter ATPase [Bacilli bacterium]|nr:energy-coupling factor transporter ATPase [Bacilli bacterium]
MAVIFHHLDFVYSPRSPFQYDALHDIDIEIKEGSFTAIIGHTGSGKSTLIQQINALLTPTDGFVSVGKEAVTPIKYKKYLKTIDKKLKNKKVTIERKNRLNSIKTELLKYEGFKKKSLRSKVGVVFQFPEYQLFADTVLKDVAFGPRNFNVSEQDAVEAAKHALELVGLDETYYERSPFDLSGGEKRRVAIAGILALRPQVLVLDEPTAGLDPLNAKQMMNLFKKIHDGGTTIILVTHDMDIVLQYASNVIVMKDGRIIEETTPHALFSDIKEDYSLEVPALYAFIRQLIDNGAPLDINKIRNVDDLAAALVTLRGAK